MSITVFDTIKFVGGDAISENLNESTCENDIHELEVTIDLDYHNKLDINNVLDYSGESDTCSKVKSFD